MYYSDDEIIADKLITGSLGVFITSDMLQYSVRLREYRI